ncbi:hypothetical protein B0H17DRAFT_1150687 [Mycena rosella]|uniref:Uncharacterized protein n=1 Tax=Mycena rosella TaxID=1033263 RepID=A0AAD7BQV4_MYCRO|nr:hypothetical protein B0H17DRAFT_1150687 [Mycena rosella]
MENGGTGAAAILADDTWMTIVWMVCSQFEPRSRAFGDAVRALSLVCRQLFGVVAGMPRLWPNLIVDCESTPAYVNRHLQNCGTRLLDVSVLHNFYPYSGTPPEQRAERRTVLSRALQTAAEATSRWGTLEVMTRGFRTMESIVDALRDKDAGSLKKLSIQCRPFPSTVPCMRSLFRSRLPCLTHMEVVGIPVPWDQVEVFAGLRHLSVRNPPPSTHPTHSEFTRILKTSTLLEILELEGVGVVDDGEGVSSAGIMLECASITVLVLGLKDGPSTFMLRRALDGARFPQLMKLHVWFSSARPATAWVGSNLWVTTPHIAIGGDVNVTEDVRRIFASMREVVTLDLREGSDFAEALLDKSSVGHDQVYADGSDVRLPAIWLAEPLLQQALYNAQNAWCRKLREVWTASESVFFVQKLAQGRIDDGLPLTTVIWEHPQLRPDTVPSFGRAWERSHAALTEIVPEFSERGPTRSLRSDRRF